MVSKPQAETSADSIASTQPGVRLARRHHLLVRVSHWLNVLLLAGLIISGISIYWASPIYQHSPDLQTGNSDYFADAGVWLCAHVPGLQSYASAPDWLYNHLSLGPYMLAPAMRLHWCCAYLFMLNALVYLAGLSLGGEWRRLLPRAGDGRGALFMAKHYLGTPFALLRRRRRVPPRFNSQYNPLQRLAYFSIPIAGFLSVITGWAIHKPMQLSWVAALFGGFDRARVWHFWLMCLFIAFVVPHVVLVFVDGWDTVRSMVTGWSRRLEVGDQFHEP
jgi:thiosulfate reductase cytochrome b subunit